MKTTKTLNNILYNKTNINILFYLMCLSSIILFVITNFFTNGGTLESLFYKLQNDWGLDFFVFLSDSAVNSQTYITGESFNPPLLKLISLFIYKSMPQDIQMIYWNSAIYSAPIDIRMQFFAILPFLLLITFSICILAITVFNIKQGSILEKSFMTFLTISSIGILFAIERGNFVILAIPLVVVFFASTKSKNKYFIEFGLICLAIASGIKIYPCLFILILLNKENISRFIRGSIYILIAFFMPFLKFSGIEGFKGMLNALNHGTGSGERVGTLNLSALPWTIGRLAGVSTSEIEKILPLFKIMSLLLLLTLILLFFITKSEWKKYTIITCIIILFTGTSHTYMLSFFIIPIISFLDRENSNATDIIFTLLFYFLFGIVPIKTNYYIENLREPTERFTTLMILQEISVVLLAFTLIFSIIVEYIKRRKAEKIDN